jgi:hypothetical protein
MKKNLSIISHNHIIKLSKAFIMITMIIMIMRNRINLSYQRSNQPKSLREVFRINQSLNLLITIKSHITLIIIMMMLSLITHLKNQQINLNIQLNKMINPFIIPLLSTMKVFIIRLVSIMMLFLITQNMKMKWQGLIDHKLHQFPRNMKNLRKVNQLETHTKAYNLRNLSKVKWFTKKSEILSRALNKVKTAIIKKKSNHITRKKNITNLNSMNHTNL